MFKLGFVSARSAFFDGKKIWLEAGVGRVIDRLRMRTSDIRVVMSRAPEHFRWLDHCMELSAGQAVQMPYLHGVAESVGKAAECRRIIGEIEAQSDALLVQLPFAAPAALLPVRGPRVYHVCADTLETVKTSDKYRGARRLAAVGLSYGIDYLYRYLIARPRTSVVTHGTELFERYSRWNGGRGRSVVSATLYDSELMSVPRTRKNDGKFQLLFVGHLQPYKGISVLLESFEQVLAQMPNAELVLVGSMPAPDKGGVSLEARAKMDALTTRGALRYLGPRGFGPDLFQCFANADVFVLPSFNEGTPRVLVEARAFGCPVIATRVGGVPDSVSDGVDGLLIPPHDARALTDAVLRVAHEPALRERLVREGLQRARSCTMDQFAGIIMEELEAVSPRGPRMAPRPDARRAY